ncbi:MAG: hypothetical protein DWP92_03900 [Armatimonadetes bacterium]|nr:MAG: hypothetical protein DWP92_03900 [Armatimonadota bacterium]
MEFIPAIRGRAPFESLSRSSLPPIRSRLWLNEDVSCLSVRILQSAIFVHRYRLMYRVTDESVHILAFIHGTRDFERLHSEP